MALQCNLILLLWDPSGMEVAVTVGTGQCFERNRFTHGAFFWRFILMAWVSAVPLLSRSVSMSSSVAMPRNSMLLFQGLKEGYHRPQWGNLQSLLSKELVLWSQGPILLDIWTGMRPCCRFSCWWDPSLSLLSRLHHNTLSSRPPSPCQVRLKVSRWSGSVWGGEMTRICPVLRKTSLK